LSATWTDVLGTDETDSSLARGTSVPGSLATIAGTNADWTNVTAEITTPKDMCKFSLRINIEQGVVMYVKYMQVKEVAVAGGTAATYEKHVSSLIEWNSTLDESDVLSINSDSLVVTHLDSSADTAGNGLASFSGEKGLFLQPGSNVLKFIDDRDGRTKAQNPEKASAGSVNLVLSYRTRYL
jgi:hypothetical protein